MPLPGCKITLLYQTENMRVINEFALSGRGNAILGRYERDLCLEADEQRNAHPCETSELVAALAVSYPPHHRTYSFVKRRFGRLNFLGR
jgi:hypothetical protein